MQIGGATKSMKLSYLYVRVLTSYPGLPPRVYLAAMEKSGCRDKSLGRRPGYEVMRVLLRLSVIHRSLVPRPRLLSPITWPGYEDQCTCVSLL